MKKRNTSPYGKLKAQIPHKGIRLKAMSVLMILLAIAVSMLFADLTFTAITGYNKSKEVRTLYIKCQRDAADMLIRIDEQSVAVRSFVHNPTLNGLDDYFASIEKTEISIDTIAKSMRTPDIANAGATLDEITDLYGKKKNTELYASYAAIKAMHLDTDKFNDKVRKMELTAADAELSDKKLAQLASQTLSDDEYLDVCYDLHLYLARYLNVILHTADSNQQTNENDLVHIVNNQAYIILALLVIVVFYNVMSHVLVIKPMNRAVTSISNKDKIAVTGSLEMKILAVSYNNMYDMNKTHENDLIYKANHDALTGLNNRGVFDRLCISAAHEKHSKVAMMMIDVDGFKLINDTYGHDVGDLALKKVANSLVRVFDNDGYVCRVGGDEFAVIIPQCGEVADSVTDRLRTVFDTVKDDKDIGIALTLSVGIALGAREGDDYDLYKHADAALYKAKAEKNKSTYEIYGMDEGSDK